MDERRVGLAQEPQFVRVEPHPVGAHEPPAQHPAGREVARRGGGHRIPHLACLAGAFRDVRVDEEVPRRGRIV